VFAAAADGGTVTFAEAWGGALAYTFQLYFDFSAYSDMAIGLSRLFGVRLPLNFNSPYKAVNVIEFWRRWHMTLSRFLRDYLYFPLGGNRKGPARRYLNLMVTMLLGGLWHGAGWTFVIWGALHGLYLVINHGWHQVRTLMGHDLKRSTRLGRFAGMSLTFVVVVIGWVFFRAENLDAALSIVSGMLGLNGLQLPEGGVSRTMFGWIAGLWLLAWLAPNTQQIMATFRPALEDVAYSGRLGWQPNRVWLLSITVGLLYAVTEMGKVSEFLYFQF
jgi:D-alanyl-lipoteichoic acid acyltransferase DltB (MBOAT superfamily)